MRFLVLFSSSLLFAFFVLSQKKKLNKLKLCCFISFGKHLSIISDAPPASTNNENIQEISCLRIFFFSFALFDFSLLCALFITISMARVHFIFQFSLVNEATTRMNAEKKMYFLFHFLCERFHFRFEKRKKNETRESRNRKNFFRFVDSLLTRSKFTLVDVECENQRF